MNIVLTIAVAVLFYLHFSSKPQTTSTVDNNKQRTDSLAHSIPTTKEQTDAKIVYLNIDTLEEKYEYYKKVNKEYRDKVIAYESGLQNKMESLQNDYNQYMQTGASLTLEQQKAKEADLQKRKDEIERMQEYKDQQEMEFAKPLDDVQNKLNAFFKAFTKDHNYSSIITFTVKGQGALGVNDELDVTNQIIKGLNDAYHEDLQKNPPKK